MTSQYKDQQYEIAPPVGSNVRESQIIGLEQQVQRMMNQMQEMAAEIEYLNRERQRMKSEIQSLANALRK